MILLEAMAAGKPIVTTNIPGYNEVVRDDIEGLLVPPKDAERLAEGLLTLLRDPDLRARLGGQGQRSAERYASPRIAEQVLDYYVETIHRRKLLRVLRRPRFRKVRRVAGGVVHLLHRRPRFRRMRRMATDVAHLLAR